MINDTVIVIENWIHISIVSSPTILLVVLSKVSLLYQSSKTMDPYVLTPLSGILNLIAARAIKKLKIVMQIATPYAIVAWTVTLRTVGGPRIRIARLQFCNNSKVSYAMNTFTYKLAVLHKLMVALSGTCAKCNPNGWKFNSLLLIIKPNICGLNHPAT